MMCNSIGTSKNQCTLLAVVCGDVSYNQREFPIPSLVTGSRITVEVLSNPTTGQFRQTLQSLWPKFVYLRGLQIAESDRLGSLVWGEVDLSTPEALCGLFGSALPSTVYLEIPNGERLAEALHAKGVPYVIYWRSDFSCYAACHFRHALLSVVQSHIWDAFQVAHSSFKLYCVGANNVPLSNGHKGSDMIGPCLLGDSPKIDIGSPEEDLEGDCSENIPAIRIYDDGVRMRFLICGVPSVLDTSLIGAFKCGLEALLKIEMRACKLHNRTSAPLPPRQAGTFNRGVVTMRCDISTFSSTHVSLLVSGSAQTCFDDQLLENHIRNEVVEKSDLVQAVPISSDTKLPCCKPRKSASVACGASVSEVCIKVPTWASQVLRQLAPDLSCRSLVMLGIASIQGLSVASFEKDDVDRLLFFCKRRYTETLSNESVLSRPPSWLVPPPGRKISEPCGEVKSSNGSIPEGENGANIWKKVNITAMRPIPRSRHRKMLDFPRVLEAERHDRVQTKTNMSVVPAKHSTLGPAPSTNRKALSSTYQAHQIIYLNPLPLKKHGCNRAPIQVCSEEEFLRDVMQFLILRGHHRLVPQGGLAEFPDAVLNANRLDLLNLYREVVSRGGFHIGNGINWKGQVFSKMRNHTLTNRMTCVGNTLKKHYETYLLEYELAHDDIGGEWCLLCGSSEGGSWVNCGVCGEWAHFGCDRRLGLGAFKDYAKTDGLEYVCPHCSVINLKNKSQKTVNG